MSASSRRVGAALGFVSLATFASSAYAQDAAPPAAVQASATAPDGAAPAPESDTGQTNTGAQPVDVHLHKKTQQAFTLGVQAGITYFTEGTPFETGSGVGRSLAAGPNLGIRASFEIFSWLAIDGRATFSNNHGNDSVRSGALSTLGGFGAVRFTLPLPVVRPYVFGGFGGHAIFASGKRTLLLPGDVAAPEAGIGVLVALRKNIDIGLEYEYSHYLGEVLSTAPNGEDGGDPNNWSVFAQYRFGN